MKTRHRLAAVCLLPAVFLAGCGGGGAATPEAAFEGFKSAMVAKDYSKAFTYLTADSQDALVGMMMIGAAFSTFGSQENADKLDAIMKKHGVDKGAESDNPAAGVSNKGALFGDIVEFIDSVSDNKEEGSFADQFKTAELKDVKIDGDKASGMAGPEPMHFAKVDGAWLIDVKASMEAAGAGRMPDMGEMPNPADFDFEMPDDAFKGDIPTEDTNPFESTPEPESETVPPGDADEPESGSSNP